jgi:hypothetical protein
MRIETNAGKVSLACAVLWSAVACASRGEGTRDTAAQAQAGNATAATAPARQRDPARASGEAAIGAERRTLPQTVVVEQAEADVIRVRILTANHLEADEIEAPKPERSASNPTPKDVGWGRLQGHTIQVDHLVAHSVRARRVIAEQIQAHSITQLRTPLRWSAPSAQPVSNQCVSAIDGGASDECFRENAFF